MPIREAAFREIEARWQAAFDPPYYAGAELRDYGMRISLAVFKDEEKIFESKDQPAGPFTKPELVERFIRAAKEEIARRFPDSPP